MRGVSVSRLSGCSTMSSFSYTGTGGNTNEMGKGPG